MSRSAVMLRSLALVQSRRLLLGLLAGLGRTVLGGFSLAGVGQAGCDLLLEGDDLVFVGRQRQRLLSLIFRLEFPPNAPIGVAKVIVDDGIVGLELDRTLERLDRRLQIAKPEISPAEAIDIVAVVRL